MGKRLVWLLVMGVFVGVWGVHGGPGDGLSFGAATAKAQTATPVKTSTPIFTWTPTPTPHPFLSIPQNVPVFSGHSFVLEVAFGNGAVPINIVENTIGFEAGEVEIVATADLQPDCYPAPAVAMIKPDSTFTYVPTGCLETDSCTGVHAVISGPVGVEDQIPPGPLYYCVVQVFGTTLTGNYPLACSNATAYDTSGDPVAIQCTSGSVAVQFYMHDTDSCAVVAPERAGSALLLLLPAIVLWGFRRRQR